MANTSKTVIVTGGSQGIGSGAVHAFLDRDYNVVATSRNVTKSKDLPSSPKLALVEAAPRARQLFPGTTTKENASRREPAPQQERK